MSAAKGMRSGLQLSTEAHRKVGAKLMRVQMAMAWPLTRAGKISPIITHEMGPKLICSVYWTQMRGISKFRACELTLTALLATSIYTQNKCSGE